MIGKPLVLDASEWLKGMSSGKHISDGGFNDDTEAVNLIAEPGVVHAPAALVDGDSDAILDDEIIASAPDEDESGNANPVIVITEDGDFMEYNGTKLVDITNGQDTTRTYAKGFTDATPYDGLFFASSKEELATWDGTTTFDFTFLNTKSVSIQSTITPRPLLVFENNLYIVDGNTLLRMTSSGATPTVILTLKTGEFIYAMGIDPGTGRILLSIVSGLNTTSTIPRINKIMWYDGFSDKVSKVILVEEMVTVFHHHQGRVYVIYGPNVGILAGVGIRFLRKLNLTLDATDDPIWKHQVISIGETMYIAEKTKALAYGPIRQGGPNVWYYAVANKVNSNNIVCLLNAGKNKLGFSVSDSKFRTVNILSVSNLDKFDFYTNWLEFPRPIQLRQIYCQFINNLSVANMTVTFDEQSADGTGRGLELVGGTNTSTSEFIIQGARFGSTIDTGKLYAFRLRFQNSTTNDGLKRIIIYYDFSE